MSLRLTCLGLVLILLMPLPSRAKSFNSLDDIKGLQYISLPHGLCKGLSETLLGQLAGSEYGSIICERDDASHILLERLVNYTSSGKAIWQVVAVKTLPKPQNGEFLINAGCSYNNDNSKPIFAIVKDNSAQAYEIKQAWAANLVTEKIEEINPQEVACSNPLEANELESPPDTTQSLNPVNKARCR